MLTGTKPNVSRLRLKALENLIEGNVECRPAVMISFSKKESIRELTARLKRHQLKISQRPRG